VRQPPAPSRALPGVEERSVLPVPPLGGTPRLPALGGPLPRKGAKAAGPRRRSASNRTPDPTPCEAGWRPSPSRSSIRSPIRHLSTASGSTPTRLAFASRTGWVVRPFARSRPVVGPPVARWANSHGFSSLVDSARRCKRRAKLAYSRFGFPTRASPRARRPVTGTPFDPDTPHDLRREGAPFSRSPEPDELSPAGVS